MKRGVDDLCREVVTLLQQLRRFQGAVERRAHAENGEVAARAPQGRFAQRCLVFLQRHAVGGKGLGHGIEALAFEEDHRVRAAQGEGEHALRVMRRGGEHHLQAGNVRDQRGPVL